MPNPLFGCNSLPLLLMPDLKCSCILEVMSLLGVLDKVMISAFCQLSQVLFLDLGITELTFAEVTASMLLAFSAMNRSSFFTAFDVDDTETMTS